MKRLILVALLAGFGCRSTEKLLRDKSPEEVKIIEQKRFERKQLPPKREWILWSISLTGVFFIYLNSRD